MVKFFKSIGWFIATVLFGFWVRPTGKSKKMDEVLMEKSE